MQLLDYICLHKLTDGFILRSEKIPSFPCAFYEQFTEQCKPSGLQLNSFYEGRGADSWVFKYQVLGSVYDGKALRH